MTDHGLSNQQLAVICALSSGATMIAAAQEVGIHRNTIANWRRNSLPFQHALAHARYERSLYFREKAEGLADLAFQSVEEILTNRKTPPSVRLKAAFAIITTATTPPEPRKQVELDTEKIVVKNFPPVAVTEDQLAPAPVESVPDNAQPTPPETPYQSSPSPQSMHNNAQASLADPSQENPHPTHNNAQRTPEICVNSRPFAVKTPDNPAQPAQAEVGRNGSCPCGSGKKYKKCCLNKPVNQGVRVEFVQRLVSAA